MSDLIKMAIGMQQFTMIDKSARSNDHIGQWNDVPLPLQLKSQTLRPSPDGSCQLKKMKPVQRAFQLCVLRLIPCAGKELQTNNCIDGYPIIEKQIPCGMRTGSAATKQVGDPYRRINEDKPFTHPNDGAERLAGSFHNRFLSWSRAVAAVWLESVPEDLALLFLSSCASWREPWPL